MAVMPSYNEMDGVPSHKNRWLLGRVLRQEWGFDGMVVSDYYAVDQMVSQHGVAADLADAARQAIEAGVDIELPDMAAYPKLADVVKSGRLSEAVLDRAVARILRAKFLAGLFDDPYVDPDRAEKVSNTPEHQAVALEAARRAIVLLKNEGGLLPLDRKRLKTIAVIGPNAKGVHLGGYSSVPGRGVDILDGITQKAGSGVRVLYSEGTRITELPANWSEDKVVFGDPVKNRQRIAEAVTVARQADLAVVVIGTNESTSREAWADNHLGDVADLSSRRSRTSSWTPSAARASRWWSC
jgi:beta-glucosidase